MELHIHALVQALVAQYAHLLVRQLLRHVGLGLLDHLLDLLVPAPAQLLHGHPAHRAVYARVRCRALDMDQVPTWQRIVVFG